MHKLIVILSFMLTQTGCTSPPCFPGSGIQCTERDTRDLLNVGVVFVDSTVLQDLAVTDNIADMTPCMNTLANVGAGDFTIRFRITTIAVTTSTVLAQRAVCDASKDFWDIDLEANGTFRIELGGPINYTVLDTTIAVNDGNSRDVLITRRAQILAATVDGVLAGSTAAPWLLGVLPPLAIAKGNPCEGAGLSPLDGVVDAVCVTVP